jgi:hypothetical protein
MGHAQRDQGPRAALDLWIARALKRAHDGTLAEALPDDLLRLTERIAAAP